MKSRFFVVLLALPFSSLFAGCPTTPGADGGSSGDGDDDDDDDDDDDAGNDDPIPVVLGPDVLRPDAVDAVLAPNPTSPTLPGGGTLEWTDAPELAGVKVQQNRDSALLILPVVSGAADYRAYILTDDVGLDVVDGKQRVLDATIYCAGFFQHNDAWNGNRELIRAVEVAGLPAEATIVVEALDTACPFTGVLGTETYAITPTNSGIPVEERVDFSIFSEADIRANYGGSLIVNGHEVGALLGNPADDIAPTVLARTTIRTAVDPTSPPPVATFFDDFQDAQPFTFISEADGRGRNQRGKIFQNDKWTAYTYGAERSDMFFDRGMLHTVTADWFQDIFSQNMLYPRQPAHLDDEDYLHVTFEVHGNATGRRYWWFFMCGTENEGETFTDDGLLSEDLIQTSFFYQPDGRNPSLDLWNCFQLFPRDGFPIDLAPTMTRPESDITLVINRAGFPERDNVVNPAPDQYFTSWIPTGWYRTMDSNGNLVKPIMDDQLMTAPRARYDVFLRRDRVVFYVNGEQRLCNDFPEVSLTMAEGAVGFGQVLYHSAAERLEFLVDYNDRSGQRYYRTNTPWVDARSWDNVGFEEFTPPPVGFNESECFNFAMPQP